MKTLIYLLTTLSHDEHVRSRQNRPRIPGPDSPVPWAALKAETVQLNPSLSLLLLDLNSRINSLADPEGFWRPQYLEKKGLSVRNTSDHREKKNPEIQKLKTQLIRKENVDVSAGRPQETSIFFLFFSFSCMSKKSRKF